MISHDITHVFLQYLWSVFALHNPLLGNIQVKSKLDVLQLWIWGWACVTSCHTHRLYEIWRGTCRVSCRMSWPNWVLLSAHASLIHCFATSPCLCRWLAMKYESPGVCTLKQAPQGASDESDSWASTKQTRKQTKVLLHLATFALLIVWNQDEPRPNLAGPLHSIAFHCIPLHSIAFHCISCSEMLWIIQPDVSPVAICLLCACLVPPRFLLQKVKWPAQIVDWPGTYCLTLRKPCIE